MDTLKEQVGGDHYKRFAIEPLEFLVKNSGQIPFAEGAVIKYVCRWRFKNGVEDLRKARHFIDVLIEAAEKEAQEVAVASMFTKQIS